MITDLVHEGAENHRRLPAEWEPQSGVVLTWPHSQEIWGLEYRNVISFFAISAALLVRDVVVHILVPDHLSREAASRAIASAGATPERFIWHRIDSDDVWARDHGPMIIESGDQPTLINWRFNAWGDKYPHQRDDQIPEALNDAWKLPVRAPSWTLEGGAIDSDGAGTLLTTRQVLLDPKRNPEVSAQQAQEQLKRWLGAHRIVWLDGGIVGDDTGGHVDTLARFVSPKRVVAPRAPRDHHDHGLLERNFATLRATFEREGTEIIELPTPNAVRAPSGVLPATYANFFITNGCCLVPAFAQPALDEAARLIVEEAVGRRAYSVDSRALITQYGGVHCVTRDLPEVLGRWLSASKGVAALPW